MPPHAALEAAEAVAPAPEAAERAGLTARDELGSTEMDDDNFHALPALPRATPKMQVSTVCDNARAGPARPF